MRKIVGCIDAHQHFWHLDRGDYGWLTAELVPLYRDFRPCDLAPQLAENGVARTILVQAAPTLAETHFLLSVAEETPFVAGVVGWVDLTASDAADVIADLARHPKFVGVRPMLQDIPDVDWILQAALHPAMEVLITHGLRLDALIRPAHLRPLRRLLERYPDLKTVIDHAAKPRIAQDDVSEWGLGWAEDIALIARETDCYCKLSGLLTEMPRGADGAQATLTPYVDHLLACFGTGRIMWGSDWPVLLLAADYPTWLKMASSLTAHLSDHERLQIFGGNAAVFYGLEDRAHG